MNALDPAALADCALAFEAKLDRLAEDLHADWQREEDAPWPLLRRLPEGPARRHAARRLFASRCGGPPALPRLLDSAGRWALLARPALTRRLCALAIVRRPGVLRCCIEKPARQGLRAALGEWFERIEQTAEGGRSVSARVAHWSPMHWACVGYWDWVGQLQADDGALRRLVRLSLPRGLLGTAKAREAAPAELAAGAALAWIEQQEQEQEDPAMEDDTPC
ncbi:hypothetical protein OOT46_20845 [Aquabacterium sp. A7-Y]|uniref:type III secretion protein HrpB4 n=1 Tax=Aquabacterium sp. A7-Y TaxID=1349605 RepID=UPI00223E501C|nr:type III secretion protein HrpB4 [Aquabacterium sp. A7-Y]MCW7540286.1 hypothetical protein [Aquabacterium sp. A7-Y]